MLIILLVLAMMENYAFGVMECSMNLKCHLIYSNFHRMISNSNKKLIQLMLSAWISLKMKLISFMLDLKTTISIKELYILRVRNILFNNILVTLLLLLKFICIQQHFNQTRVLIYLTLCYQPHLIGLLSCGILKSEMTLYLLLNLLKNMYMTFNGVVFIQVFLLLVMVKVILISGILTKIKKHLLQERKLGRMP